TFGNAAELIIALIALWQGEKELVKASIAGSIIGNVLLVLGLAILVGGLYHQRQVFNRTAASLGATLLALAGIGLIVPTIYFYLHPLRELTTEQQDTLNFLSEEIAVVLALMYVLSLVFTLKTHQHLFAGPAAEAAPPAMPAADVPGREWSWRTSLLVLL